MRWTDGGFEMDDDRSRLGMERIVGWLKASYWAGSQPEPAICRSWDAAGVVLGIYHGDELVDCARAVTDFTRFAYLSDVYVEPGYRGRGFGRWLVGTTFGHPEIGPVRWGLHTRSYTTKFYRKFGFEVIGEESERSGMRRPKPQLRRGCHHRSTTGARLSPCSNGAMSRL